jgi:cytoskeletal protein RodZ
MWAGASVLGVLILAGAVGNNAKPDTVATATPAAEQRVVAAPTSTSAGASGTARSSTAPITTSRVATGVGDAAPAERTIRTTTPTTTRTTNVKPAPRSTAAERTTTTRKSEAPTEKSSGCDPNYSGCVPIASDVDCEGGSGNGPAYVTGPVRIVGTDIYGLDGGGEPGVGCE